MPKLPERKPLTKSDGEPPTRPYTRMALHGLSAGLTWRDMRQFKFTHLMQFLWEWEDMNGAEVDEIHEATPSDVMALTRL